jgi:hypothetical protein
MEWLYTGFEGMRLRSWLRHYATCRKAADSIPDKVIKFFN